MTITLHGPVPSKKNLLRVSRSGGLFRDREIAEQIKALEAQAWVAWHYMTKKPEPIEHPDMQVRFYVKDSRGDRDNKLTTVLDCLQKAGVIANDNIRRFNGTLTLLPAVIDPQERVVIEIQEA